MCTVRFGLEVWSEVVCTVWFGLEVLERDHVHCGVWTGGLARDCVH